MLSSEGKMPTTSARRFTSLFRRSRGLVTGMRISVPMFGWVPRDLAYAASIRDRGTGSTKVRAGRCTR